MSEHVDERLSAWFDGELSPDERRTVDAHLRDCARCQEALDAWAVLDRLAAEDTPVVPEGYFEGLPRRVRERVARPARRPLWAWMAAGAGLATLAAALLVIPQLPQPLAPPSRETASASAHDEVLSAPPATSLAVPLAAQASAKPAPPPAPRRQDRDMESERAARSPEFAQAPLEDGRLKRDEGKRGREPAGFEEDGKAKVERPALVAEERADQPPAPPPPPAPMLGSVAERDADPSASMAAKTPGGAPPERRGFGVGGAAKPQAAGAAGRDLEAAAAARTRRRALLRQAEVETDPVRADEARFAAFQAAVSAWRASALLADHEQVRADAAAYLRRPDARQREQVERLLSSLSDR